MDFQAFTISCAYLLLPRSIIASLDGYELVVAIVGTFDASLYLAPIGLLPGSIITSLHSSTPGCIPLSASDANRVASGTWVPGRILNIVAPFRDTDGAGIITLDAVCPGGIIGAVASGDASRVGIVPLFDRGRGTNTKVSVVDELLGVKIVGLGQGRGYGDSEGDSRAGGEQNGGLDKHRVLQLCRRQRMDTPSQSRNVQWR